MEPRAERPLGRWPYLQTGLSSPPPVGSDLETWNTD